jgi:hypothetical protein
MRERERKLCDNSLSNEERQGKKTTKNNMSPQKSKKRRRNSFIKRAIGIRRRPDGISLKARRPPVRHDLSLSLSRSLLTLSLYAVVVVQNPSSFALDLLSSSCLPSFLPPFLPSFLPPLKSKPKVFSNRIK